MFSIFPSPIQPVPILVGVQLLAPPVCVLFIVSIHYRIYCWTKTQNAVTKEVALMPSRKWPVRIRLWDWWRGGRELVNGTSCRSRCSRRSVLTAEEQAWAERSPCPWERLVTPGGKQSNEAVSALALSAHTLVSRRKLRDKQQKRSFSIQEFLLPPFDRKSRPALPVFPSHSPTPPLLSGMKGRPLFVSMKKTAPPQMFHRSHLIRRWDSSNQSSQLPLKSHHFPLITDLICA